MHVIHRSHLYRKHGINVDNDDSTIDATVIDDGIDDTAVQQVDDIEQTSINSTTITNHQ